MAIETKNHACRRDLEKTLITTDKYDNGQGGTLSIIKKTKTKTKGGNPLKSTNNVFNKKTIPITENQATFMNKLGLKPMYSGSLDPINFQDMVVNHLAPFFIQSEGGN